MEISFRIFVRTQPEIVRLLTIAALSMKTAGKKRGSIRYLWEQLRIQYPNLARMDDHHHSRMARLLMDRNPELRGFFQTRVLRS